MHRLLIVDDEPMTVEGLYEVLANALGEGAAIYKTDSSAMAMEMIRAQRFDLVLTDIRMPEITGLELAAELIKRWPQTHLIFLTGYGEFDAVYEAIQYPHVSYILKIEGHERIAEAVLSHIEQIEAERCDEQMLIRAREHLRAALPLLQRDLIQKLLEGVPVEGMGEQFASMEMPFDAREKALLLCACAADAKMSASEEIARLHALLECFIPADRSVLYLYGRMEKLMIWILQPARGTGADELANYVKGILPAIQDTAAEMIGEDVSFVANVPVAWDRLSDALSEIRQLLSSPMAAEQNLALSLSDLPKSEESATVARRVELDMRRLNLLSHHLERDEDERFMKELKQLIEHALVGSWLPPHCYTVQLAIALFFCEYISVRTAPFELPEWLCGAYFFRTMDDALAAYARTAARIVSAQRSGRSSWRISAIEQVCAHIDQNLREDLSLIQLADRFHFNPKYLSRLFKQKTGLNLSDYINRKRMEVATRLLNDEAIKIQEVGRMVGFESAPYFTRFFKRNLGVSPQGYRDGLRNK